MLEDDFSAVRLRRTRVHPMVAIVLFAATVGIGAGLLDARLAPAARSTGPTPAAALIGSGSLTVVRLPVTATTVATEPFPVVPSGPIACTPDAPQHCIAAAERGAQPAVLVTTDGGSDWTAAGLPALPADRALTAETGVACPTRARCILAGNSATGAVLLQSLDGGHTWATGALPPALRTVVAIDCPTSNACMAIGTRSPTAQGAAAIAASADAGRTWSLAATPAAVAAVNALACTPRVCVVGGEGPTGQTTPTGTPIDHGVLVTTADGGRHWRSASLPGSLAGATIVSIACTAGGSCTGLSAGGSTDTTVHILRTTLGRLGPAHVAAGGPLPTIVHADGSGDVTIACLSTDCLLTSGTSPLVASADGGLTWHTVGIEHSARATQPIPRSVTCSDEHCLVAWYSILPDSAGISFAGAPALAQAASIAAGRQQPGRLPVPFTSGVTPGGVLALDVACGAVTPEGTRSGTSGDALASGTDLTCALGALGGGTAWSTGAASGQLRRIPLPGTQLSSRGFSAPIIRSVVCDGTVCGVLESQVHPHSGAATTIKTTFAVAASGPNPAPGGIEAPPRTSILMANPATLASACGLLQICWSPDPGTTVRGATPAVAISRDRGPWETTRPVFASPAPALRVVRGTSSVGDSVDVSCLSTTTCLAARVTPGPSRLALSRTTDGGRSWEPLRTDLPAGASAIVSDVDCDVAATCAVESSSHGGTFVTIGNVVTGGFHSTGFAASRADFLAPVGCAASTCLAPASVGGAGGVLVTTDAGRTWLLDEVASVHGEGRSTAERRQAATAASAAFAHGATVACAAPTICLAVIPSATGQLIERLILGRA